MHKLSLLAAAVVLCTIQVSAVVPADLQNVHISRQCGHQVLVAADPAVPVLGYFDAAPESGSPEMQSFFTFYEEAVRRIEAGASADEVFLRIDAAVGDTVGPLLGNIRYGQGAPFNNQCPALNNEGRSVTGCVATSMAQVMRYYRHPSCGTGVCTYTGRSGATDFDLSTHPFNWDNILESYIGNYTTTQANAVANLMLACGASVNMSYSADGSGSQADKACLALKNNFNYPNAKYFKTEIKDEEMRQDVLVDDWAWTMRENMDAGHPVIYAGSSGSGITGHCFVADGYTIDAAGNTYFHINWGWEGSMDGWFLITCFQPDPNDTNYSAYSNTMVVDIYPEGWTSVESVEAPGTYFGFHASLPVYTLLGMRILPEYMTRGNIYVQQGHKFIW